MSGDSPEVLLARIDERTEWIVKEMQELKESCLSDHTNHEERITGLEDSRSRQYGACAGVGAVAGLFTAVLAWVKGII